MKRNKPQMYTEFLAATLEAHGYIEEERIAAAFDRLDSDDSGKRLLWSIVYHASFCDERWLMAD